MRARVGIVLAGAVIVAATTWGLAMAYAALEPAREPALAPPTAATPSADTTLGIDAELSTQFETDITPSNAEAAVSRDEALAAAKGKFSAYAATASSVTIRHVVFTDRNLARLSDAQLANMGVAERPDKLDAWMVTFHKIAPRRHGPRGPKRPAPANGNFVVFISSATGKQVGAMGYGPVK